jgi:hypothetical protein
MQQKKGLSEEYFRPTNGTRDMTNDLKQATVNITISAMEGEGKKSRISPFSLSFVLSFGVAIAERSQKWDSLLRAPFF